MCVKAFFGVNILALVKRAVVEGGRTAVSQLTCSWECTLAAVRCTHRFSFSELALLCSKLCTARHRGGFMGRRIEVKVMTSALQVPSWGHPPSHPLGYR